MTKHSPHTRWKGCCLECAIHRDAGQAKRQPLSTLRIVGKIRRVSRHELPDGDE